MNDLLTSRPVPPLNQQLMAQFTPAVLETREALHFDSSDALEAVLTGGEALAIDIGGNKVAVAQFAAEDGWLKRRDEYHSPRSQDGRGYFDTLKTAAKTAIANDLPVGISFAGPVKDGKPAGGPNVPVLLQDLQNAGGFNTMFGTSLKSVDNDAAAGLKAAAVWSKQRDSEVNNVIFIIVGSGLGGAVLKGSQLLTGGPGHIAVPAELNPFHRTEPCGLYGRSYTCLERVGSGKAGIEATWKEITGNDLSAPEIQELADAGNEDAIKLYDISAVIAVHTIVGLGKVRGVSLDAKTVVACHGGIFNHDSYRPRVIQLLKSYGYDVPVIFTRDFSDNACLEGAAIAALAAD